MADETELNRDEKIRLGALKAAVDSLTLTSSTSGSLGGEVVLNRAKQFERFIKDGE